MPESQGVFCSECHRRYLSHLGLPCRHEEYELKKGNVIPPTKFIECYINKSRDEIEELTLKEFRFPIETDKSIRAYSRIFQVRSCQEDQLNNLFLDFLKTINAKEWVMWVEAYQSICFDKFSRRVPVWREKQLMEKDGRIERRR